jgi:hypothetical protein
MTRPKGIEKVMNRRRWHLASLGWLASVWHVVALPAWATVDLAAAPTPTAAAAESTHDRGPVSWGAWTQVQWQHSQASQDELQQGGQPFNQDTFVVRRGRLWLRGQRGAWSGNLQIEANTARGAYVGLREAELAWHRELQVGNSPLRLRLTAGLSTVPFGLELQTRQEDLLPLERTGGSLALFPGQPDTGVQLALGWGPLQLQAAVVSGKPVVEQPGFAGADPLQAVDVVARAGGAVQSSAWQLAAGVSFLQGRGFSAGTDASKARLLWRDLNDNGGLDTGETTAVTGQAARPSSTFAHWAVGADFSTALHTAIGWTRLEAEGVVAQNLDRGLFVSDPVLSGRDLRQLLWRVLLVQDRPGLGFVGFRYDSYNPDRDATDDRSGIRLAVDRTQTTLSPLAGLWLAPRLRLVTQYDHVVDTLARDATGVPTDLRNDRWVLRLHGAW